MKKFAQSSLFFVLFFVIFFVLINSIFLIAIASTDWDFKKRIETLKFDNPDFELLILGTSLAEYGIDAKLLTSRGIKSFTLAFVGSSIRTNYIQLNEYLSKCQKKPQYVLLALNSVLESFEGDGIEPIVQFTDKDFTYQLRDAPITKFRWLGVELLKKILWPTYRKAEVYNGQIQFQITNPDKTENKELQFNLQKYESSLRIQELAGLCEKNGIELIIVEIPGFKETQNLTEIGPYTLHYDNGCSAVLYNFNNQDFCKMFDANKDWCGRSHLNATGANKFTEQLLRKVLSK